MTTRVPTVAACQMAVADLDVAANLRTIADRAAALPDRTDVALFPEYALTGFVADTAVYDAAVSRDDPEVDRLREVAAENDLALLVGLVERAGDRPTERPESDGDTDSKGGEDAHSKSGDDAYYNTAAYVRPDGDVTVYRKRHHWGSEADFLARGTDRVTVETPVGTTGLLTCYDLNFVGDSAAFAREAVDALFVVGAWPAAHSQNWKLLLRARALDGVRWVVGANRTGERRLDERRLDGRRSADAPRQQYAGRSRVVRPDGSVAAGLNRGERDLVADLDPAVLAEQREFIPVHEDAVFE